MKNIEGGIQSPTRHKIEWQSKDYTNSNILDQEMRRVFDVCHSCRRCFNLCDSFPNLFDIIDESSTGELDSVSSKSFSSVVDSCTLCDLCFLSKCPYVPPHEFNIDFPHLMLRYRVAENSIKTRLNFFENQLLNIDRNGKIFVFFAPLTNIFIFTKNFLIRFFIATIFNIHKKAQIPKYSSKTFSKIESSIPDSKNILEEKAYKKVVIYTTCFANYNNTSIAIAAKNVLEKNNIFTKVVYPECCGMPNFEAGDLKTVTDKAIKISSILLPWIDKGYDIITLTPSCSLMLKSEWPLLLPENNEVLKLSKATKDICEFVVEVSKDGKLNRNLLPLNKKVSFHLACHSKAQNIGNKGLDMLRIIPEISVSVVDKCSGHGGTFGLKKDTFPSAQKYGKMTAKKIEIANPDYIVSECPLAGKHIGHMLIENNPKFEKLSSKHPIELLSMCY